VSDSPAPIAVQLNGELVTCAPQLALLDFLAERQLEPRAIAIEYNGEILHRQNWPTTRLAEGDRLEVVTIVGGG